MNSRGRAALCEAYGFVDSDSDPERVETMKNGLTLSGSDVLSHLTVGFAQSRLPTAIKFGSFQDQNLAKKTRSSSFVTQIQAIADFQLPIVDLVAFTITQSSMGLNRQWAIGNWQ